MTLSLLSTVLDILCFVLRVLLGIDARCCSDERVISSSFLLVGFDFVVDLLLLVSLLEDLAVLLEEREELALFLLEPLVVLYV